MVLTLAERKQRCRSRGLVFDKDTRRCRKPKKQSVMSHDVRKKCDILQGSYTKKELLHIANILKIGVNRNMTENSICRMIALSRPDLMKGSGWKWLKGIGSVVLGVGLGASLSSDAPITAGSASAAALAVGATLYGFSKILPIHQKAQALELKKFYDKGITPPPDVLNPSHYARKRMNRRFSRSMRRRRLERRLYR